MTPYEQLALIIAEQKAEIARLRAAFEQIEATAMSRPVYEIVYIARKALANE